jgi:hypothetical protein
VVALAQALVVAFRYPSLCFDRRVVLCAETQTLSSSGAAYPTRLSPSYLLQPMSGDTAPGNLAAARSPQPAALRKSQTIEGEGAEGTASQGMPEKGRRLLHRFLVSRL